MEGTHWKNGSYRRHDPKTDEDCLNNLQFCVQWKTIVCQNFTNLIWSELPTLAETPSDCFTLQLAYDRFMNTCRYGFIKNGIVLIAFYYAL